MAEKNKKLTQDDILVMLGKIYDSSLQGIPKVSVPIGQLANDYLSKASNLDEAAKSFILSRLDKKAHRSIWSHVPQMIEDMIAYDLHFMRLTGVLDENDEPGENEYDEDEAFEFIYDAYLSDHPQEEDDDMMIASLLNRYMELQAEYL